MVARDDVVPRELEPLFYSEISSSFLLYRILDAHRGVAREFTAWAGIPAGDGGPIVEEVLRERSYPGQGAIDLLLSGTAAGRRFRLLVEVKVHDYLSATPGQIVRYYNAAAAGDPAVDTYFLYLTQYTADSLPKGPDVVTPGSVIEWGRAAREVPAGRLRHRSWTELHGLLETHEASFTATERLMLRLQRAWIRDKEAVNIREFGNGDVGARTLRHFFEDLDFDLVQRLPFGVGVNAKGRSWWSVPLDRRPPGDLDEVRGVVLRLCRSTSLSRDDAQPPDPRTTEAVARLLARLGRSAADWPLVAFYSNLFAAVLGLPGVQLNGTGGHGFSIRAHTRKHGWISLCTFRTGRHTAEFQLLR